MTGRWMWKVPGRWYLLCQSENLSLVNSSKLGIHLQVLLIQSLRKETKNIYYSNHA